jgi:hypothetical protein
MKGYVALTTVLVMLPLLLLTGINSLYGNISSLIIGKMNYDYEILRTNSETCLEEAVYRIKRGGTFVGTFDLTMGNWSCSVTVVDKSGFPGVKVINILATDDNGVSITNSKELNINVDPFELSNI